MFATHARQWLDSRNDELTTKARDASIMQTHVLPQWGSWQLSKIDHLSVQKWITELGTHRSPATVAEAHRLTSAVLRSAVRNRLIAFNPCEGIRFPGAADTTPLTRSSAVRTWSARFSRNTAEVPRDHRHCCRRRVALR